MTEEAPTLEEARAAYARREWVLARAGLRAAAEQGPLAAADRYALAQTDWWLGDIDESNHHLEEAHRRYLEEDNPAAAAGAALELGIAHLMRNDIAIGSGWVARAARLADELPEGPLHGYLVYVLEVEAHLGKDVDPSGVLEAARRVQDIGRRFGELTLAACGLVGEGRALIKAGRVPAGMALLDEAMVSVVAGEVADEWTGNLYCNTIAVCHELGDFARMAAWTQATERWLEGLPDAVLFAGICRVHRAQLLSLKGEWTRAEREAVRVSEELAAISIANAAEAWYEVGEIRRRRGEHEAADQAYQRAHELGRDPQPGLALLCLAQGRIAPAASTIRAALVATAGDRLARAHLCAAQVEIALAAGDPETARRAGGELDEVAAACKSPGLEAIAAASRGAVLLAEEQPEEALGVLREACRRWRELGAPYEAARTGALLARTYAAMGDEEAAARERGTAAAAFERLGAVRDLAAVVDRQGGVPKPGGLSDREVEVLRLVADGCSNPEIAELLFISPKTVARHLSNMFAKLGVTSRTEAARYAFDHGLVSSDP